MPRTVHHQTEVLNHHVRMTYPRPDFTTVEGIHELSDYLKKQNDIPEEASIVLCWGMATISWDEDR